MLDLLQQLLRAHLSMSALVLQVDSFNRHASGKSGNKLIARLPNKLFGSKKSPRTPSPSSGGLVPSPSGNSITLDDMLVYQNVGLLAAVLQAVPVYDKSTCHRRHTALVLIQRA